jgi:hypothetical protein
MTRCSPAFRLTTTVPERRGILFRDAGTLARLYPKLVHHGLVTFLSPDVMRFLGRKVSAAGAVPPRLEADVVSDMKTRPEGVRIKHRLGGNSIKMYDKQGSVLRVETTINEASGFKSFRAPEGRPEAGRAWLRKGIADLHRRAARRPTSAICRLWHRSMTPSAWANLPAGCASRRPGTVAGFAP